MFVAPKLRMKKKHNNTADSCNYQPPQRKEKGNNMGKVIKYEKQDIVYPVEENAVYSIRVSRELTPYVNVLQKASGFEGWTIYIEATNYDQLEGLRKQGLALLKEQLPLS